MVTQKKNVFIEEDINIQWDIDKHLGTCISLVKHLVLSEQTVNVVVENYVEENDMIITCIMILQL